MVGTSGGGSASGGISRTCPKGSCRRASDSPRVPCEAPSRCSCAASLPLSRLEGTARLHAAAHSGRSRVAPRARWSADTRSQRSSRCRQSQQKTARQGPLWGLPSLGLPSRPTRRRRHARRRGRVKTQERDARYHGTPSLRHSASGARRLHTSIFTAHCAATSVAPSRRPRAGECVRPYP